MSIDAAPFRIRVTAAGAGAPVLTTITVTPDPVSVVETATEQFTANGFDQFAASISAAGGVWSVVPGTGTGSISVGGLFTATTAGTVTVRYTHGAIIGDSDVTVTAVGAWTALYLDSEGHSNWNDSTTQLGGATRWSTAEILPEMVAVPVTGTNWGLSGRHLTEMGTDWAGHARPDQPVGTLRGFAIMEALNEVVLLNNYSFANLRTKMENLILLAVDSGKYDFVAVYTPAAAGYNNWWESLALPLKDYLDAGLVFDAGRPGHAVGSPLCPDPMKLLVINVTDSVTYPAFNVGGLKRGDETDFDTDPAFTPADATNFGGIVGIEAQSRLDWASVHVTSNGSHMQAALLMDALVAQYGLVRVEPTSFEFQHRARGTGVGYTEFTAGPIEIKRGFPLAVKVITKTAGVEDPAFTKTSIANTALNCEYASDMQHLIADPPSGLRAEYGTLYTKAGQSGPIILRARHGRVSGDASIPIDETGEDMPWPFQRIRVGWGAGYNNQCRDEIDESNILGMFLPGWRCTTPGGMVVGERVTQMTDARSASGPTIFTVPGGKVGPILRRVHTQFSYPPDHDFWRYWLEFDSANAALESNLVSAWALDAQDIRLHIVARIDHAVTGSVSHAVKVHASDDSEMIALDTAESSPRLYYKTATQSGHAVFASPMDRITGSPKWWYMIRKHLSVGERRVNLNIENTAGSDETPILEPNFAAGTRKITLGNVDYMELYGMGGFNSAGVSGAGQYWRQNTFLWM